MIRLSCAKIWKFREPCGRSFMLGNQIYFIYLHPHQSELVTRKFREVYIVLNSSFIPSSLALCATNTISLLRSIDSEVVDGKQSCWSIIKGWLWSLRSGEILLLQLKVPLDDFFS